MKAAIFDMDGTLVDTLDIHLRAYMNVSKRRNIPMDTDFVKMRFGMTAKEIFKENAKQRGLEIDADQLAQEKFEEFDRIAKVVPVYPGTVEVLNHFKEKGIHLALASGSGRQNVDTVLTRSNLGQYFEVTVAGNEAPRGKEFPDLWIRAAELLGVLPEECMVFEDAYYGAQSAKQAGMMVIGVLTGHTSHEELSPICDFVLNSLAEFKNVSDKI